MYENHNEMASCRRTVRNMAHSSHRAANNPELFEKQFLQDFSPVQETRATGYHQN